MTVRRDTYSKKRPKIEPDDLQGGDFALATIIRFEEIKVQYGKEDARMVPALLTEEFGDKVLWLNATQVGYLIDRLGDNELAWVGKRIPLVKTVATFGEERFPKVTVAVPEEWDDLLAMANGVSAPAKRTRRPATPAKHGKRK